MKKLSFILLITAISFASCYYDNLSELHPPGSGVCDTAGVVTYNNQVSKIYENFCGTNGSCHSANLANGGIILDSYQEAYLVDDSTLIASIEHTGSNPVTYMPQGEAMLSECNINTIKKWIATGKAE